MNPQPRRRHERFPSPKGELTVEQLWDVPLTGGDFNLNAIAKAANKAYKEVTEENFVETTTVTPEQRRRAMVLETIKSVIEMKIEEVDTAKTRADKKAKKAQLVGILAEKENDKLAALGVAELKRQIKELDEE